MINGTRPYKNANGHDMSCPYKQAGSMFYLVRQQYPIFAQNLTPSKSFYIHRFGS